MSGRPSDLQAVIAEMRDVVAARKEACGFVDRLFVTDWADRLAVLAPVTADDTARLDWLANAENAMELGICGVRLDISPAMLRAAIDKHLTPSREQGEGS